MGRLVSITNVLAGSTQKKMELLRKSVHSELFALNTAQTERVRDKMLKSILIGRHFYILTGFHHITSVLLSVT